MNTEVKLSAKMKESALFISIRSLKFPRVMILEITLACLIYVLIKRDVSVRAAGLSGIKSD